MAVYTVVIDTGDAEQDDVLQALEQVPEVVIVRFMGPGSLIEGTDESTGEMIDAEPVCEACGEKVDGLPEVRAGLALCDLCDMVGAALASGDDEGLAVFSDARIDGVRRALEDRPASAGTQFDLGGPSDETVATYGID